MFLYEKIDNLREYGYIAEVPNYIKENLNPKLNLREYQIKAFENFITHYENKNTPRPLQVLFHMATGSGKTLIMAGLIIYLYKQGYRNFLFFVNLTNILDKTRENFLNAESAKYLFAQELNIDGEKINVNVVENFQSVDEDAINICFETTQGLNTKINMPRENSVTLEDFKEYKIVFISDEAHHLNATTKKGNVDNDEFTWENTIEKIFSQNAENILLEFTATCDLSTEKNKAKYSDKIIFDYPLQKFYNDGFSKEILSLRADLTRLERALQAVILSQYRLKLFQAERLNIKPVILFKSLKIDESQEFMAEFLETIKHLNGGTLRELSKKLQHEMTQRAFEYFASNGITFEMLAAELRDDFSEQHCISVNDDKDAQNNQILLNSLENVDNPYRAIFEVKKLDEGWDVLNLFDISGGKKISQTTISEAQLIGRGARYCPFQLNDEQEKFKRKFDKDAANKLRICETLFYHCQNDSRYIDELKKALKEIGLDLDKIVTREYTLKKSFKQTDLYKYGVIYVNTRVEIPAEKFDGLPPAVCEKIYRVEFGKGGYASESLLSENVAQVSTQPELFTVRKTIGEIAAINFALVNKALRKFPVYKFDNLKSIFENLHSTREFIFGENFLSGVKIDIVSTKKIICNEDLYFAVVEVLGKIAAEIEKPQPVYKDTEKFHSEPLAKIFTNKEVHYTDSKGDGAGISQKDVSEDLRLDLSDKNWFAYNDNFGTPEEKAFVIYFNEHIKNLEKVYDKIYLLRNERQCKIYDFDKGRGFEPDYVLLLQKKNSAPECFQIFIEMKGDGFLANDAWKEKFLLQLKDKVIIEENDNYRIWGFHFYNQAANNNFDADFNGLTNLND